MAEKKDYSKSAVKLCNPPEVKTLLEKLKFEQAKLTQLEVELRESNGKLMGKIAGQTAEVTGLQLAIREAVEEHGSYQDIENERYAVKFARVSKSYHIEPFKQYYPKESPMVVTEAINVEALKGLMKGKILDEETLKRQKVITETESFVFYVR